jgi:predicted hotdog family 3-hydroxylacyl-ACP dehydratase
MTPELEPTPGPAPQTLDRAGIAARIPHAGTMCLLDAMHGWSDGSIHCSTRHHAAPDHPLRGASGLLAPTAIEYASQAMALHAGLMARPGDPPRAGFLAAVRNVVMRQARLDTAPGPLHVRAERLLGDARQAQYRFTLHDGEGLLLVEGRATVVLDGSPADPLSTSSPKTA